MAPNVHGNKYTYEEIVLPCGLQLQLVEQQCNKSLISLQKWRAAGKRGQEAEVTPGRISMPVHHKARGFIDPLSSWVLRMLYRCWDLGKIHLYYVKNKPFTKAAQLLPVSLQEGSPKSYLFSGPSKTIQDLKTHFAMDISVLGFAWLLVCPMVLHQWPCTNAPSILSSRPDPARSLTHLLVSSGKGGPENHLLP